MKILNRIILGSFVLISGYHASCSRLLSSERNKVKLIQKDDVILSDEQSELLHGNHVVQLTDSSHKIFKIEIFPLDTFSFSLKDGFKGMASRIELSGLERGVIKVSDSTGFKFEKKESLQFERENKIITGATQNTKEVKRNSTFGYWGMFLGGFIIALLGLFQIYKRFKAIRS